MSKQYDWESLVHEDKGTSSELQSYDQLRAVVQLKNTSNYKKEGKGGAISIEKQAPRRFLQHQTAEQSERHQ